MTIDQLPSRHSPRATLLRRGVALACGTLLFCVSHLRADYSNTIHPAKSWGEWEGWGMSLCWMGKAFGDREDIADLLFTGKQTVLEGVSLPGLKLNIVRYNAGACSEAPAKGERMNTLINPVRQMEGFWLNPESTDPASASWDWNVDANQRMMLQKAKQRGATTFELFSNSPMWWMCSNRNPAGSDDGTSDNIAPAFYRPFATYLATIARYAQDHWGIEFDTVEPFNEPVSTWWKGGSTKQEGCHIGPDAQSAIIGELRAELDKRELKSVAVAASDTNSYDEGVSTWKALSESARTQIGQINVHGYQEGAGDRAGLHQISVATGKKLYNSEYGEGDPTGLRMATNIHLDFHHLHPVAWSYWQPLDGGGWGLIRASLGERAVSGVNTKYFVLAHYSRHIRPGMIIIDSGEPNTVAAYDRATDKLVLVTVNYGTPQNVTYDLGEFGMEGAKITRWVTATGEGDRYVRYEDIRANGRRVTVPFGANTVQTVEIENAGGRPASTPPN